MVEFLFARSGGSSIPGSFAFRFGQLSSAARLGPELLVAQLDTAVMSIEIECLGLSLGAVEGVLLSWAYGQASGWA